MNKTKIVFKQISGRYYKGENGCTMRLNEQTKVWALLNADGKEIDTDGWRYDLAERNGIQLKA